MSRIKDDREEEDTQPEMSEELPYVILDQLMANYVYLPDEYNLNNLQEFYNQFEWDSGVEELYSSVVDGSILDGNPSLKDNLDKNSSHLPVNRSQLVDVVSVLSEEATEVLEQVPLNSPEQLDEEISQEIKDMAEIDAEVAFDDPEFDLTESVNSAVQEYFTDSVTFPTIVTTYLQSWTEKSERNCRF